MYSSFLSLGKPDCSPYDGDFYSVDISVDSVDNSLGLLRKGDRLCSHMRQVKSKIQFSGSKEFITSPNITSTEYNNVVINYW